MAALYPVDFPVVQALADSEEAGKIADKYQPVIIQAEKDKRAADFEFQKFAQATSEVDSWRIAHVANLARNSACAIATYPAARACGLRI